MEMNRGILRGGEAATEIGTIRHFGAKFIPVKGVPILSVKCDVQLHLTEDVNIIRH